MDTESNHKNARHALVQVPRFEDKPLAFKGVRFDVHTLELPGKDGHHVRRDVVVHPGSVIILPLLDNAHLIMIRNQRFAVGKELWELPAGTREPKEEPLETAKRELIEETGYQAKRIEPLLTFYTTPGITNEVMYGYVAKELSFVGQHLDESERIVVETLTWKKALEFVKDGTIVDGKTISTLLYFHSFCSF